MREPIPFVPKLETDWTLRVLDVPTAWNGIEAALSDLMDRFQILPVNCLEFGCDYGYSTSALANYFSQVVAVDTFQGDAHAGFREPVMFEQVSENFQKNGFDNVLLMRMDLTEFIRNCSGRFSLIHVDVFHEYLPTKIAARWAVDHAPVTICHDTRSFPEVMQACGDVAEETGCHFYEWDQCHGLGILSRRPL